MTQTYSDNNIEATNGFAALITAIALVIASLFLRLFQHNLFYLGYFLLV